MSVRFSLAFGLSLLLATPALAQAVWVRYGGTQTSSVSSGGVVLYDFVAADSTGFSPLLQAFDCDFVTVQFDPDTASTGGNAEAYLYSCLLNATPTTSHCGKVLSDLDGNGVPDDSTLNGADGTGSVAQRRFVYDVKGLPLLAINRSSAAVGAETPRVMLKCGAGGYCGAS